ncbi:YncE family protein, partial [bacterium]|nr:YncE family protein [bacterium]
MRILLTLILFLTLLTSAWAPESPGSLGKGVILLPNGWKIQPAGKHIPLDDLPLEMIESPDGRFLIVTNSGYSPPILSVIELAEFRVKDRVKVKNAWLGLAMSADGSTIYSSTGGNAEIQTFDFKNGKLTEKSLIKLDKPNAKSFVGGITLSPDGKRLYAVQILGNTLHEIDTASGSILRTLTLDAEPYTIITTSDGKKIFVSLWGGAKVLEIDSESYKITRTLNVGEHPNAMQFSKDGNRLFVACGNTNSVWALDLTSGTAQEQISVALYPHAPEGATPSGLGISPDGFTLLVTNSDNNAVAVVDISQPGKSKVRGFIPSGWYPTAARFTRDGKKILILSGKGLTSTANPRGPDEPNFIGQLLLGTLSMLDVPNDEQLAAYTKTVYALTPYSDAIRLTPAHAPQNSPIPSKVGGSSPIKYIFYVLRENRTYDQVFGDMEKGNGDPNLCLFGE